MKINKLFALISLAMLALQVSAQQVTLKISSIPSVDKTVSVRIPVKSMYFNPSVKQYLLKNNNQLEVKMAAFNPGIVQVDKYYNSVNLLCLGKAEAYSLYYQGEKQDWLIKGPNAAGQTLFNKLFKDDTRSRFEELDKFPQTADRVKYVNEQKAKDLAKFKALLVQKKISSTFYTEVAKQADVYYRLLLSTDLFFIHQGFSKPKIDFDSSHLAAYKNAVSVIKEDYVKRSNLYPVFLSRYMSYLELQGKADGKGQDVEEKKYAGNYCFNQIHKIRSVFDKRDAELPWATLISEGVEQNHNEKEWIENFREFKNIYPSSLFIANLNPMIRKIEDYQQSLIQEHLEIKFLTDTEAIQTIEQLGEAVKGKITYVDLWATWCGPCREELQYSIKLHQKFEAIGVQSLYVSIDNPSADAGWKVMLKGLNLKGFHIRTSEALHKDLNTKVPKFTGIPRYLIFNKEGKVVNWDAKRPSDGNLLLEQLKAVN